MRKISVVLSFFALIFMITENVSAAPFSYNVTNDVYSDIVNGIPTARDSTATDFGYPDIYEAVNRIMGTSYTSNSAIDDLFVTNDSYWQNISGITTVIGYSAYNAGTLGVYSSGDTHDVTTAYSGQGFNPGFDTYDINMPQNTTFGWYLEVSNPNNNIEIATYYSDSTMNPDGYDHMMTFDLGGPFTFNGQYFENPYLIAWENQGWNDETQKLGNEDYNDLIFIVDATPVPEPATLFLLGSGLVLLAGMSRKKNNNN